MSVHGELNSPYNRCLPARIVMSSRVRLARNLSGTVFPGQSSASERRKVMERLTDIVSRQAGLDAPVVIRMEDADAQTRSLLMEEHIISADLFAQGCEGAVVFDNARKRSVMINEEDHLRLQIVAAGQVLSSIWGQIEDLDSRLACHVDYAFSKEFGYLTACPSNAGTGMRASVLMHLAGLGLCGESEQVVHGLNRTGFMVRGCFGEGSEAYGHFYQISNQRTLGVSVRESLESLEDMVLTLETLELQARQRLLQKKPIRLEDHVARMLGLLRYARLINTGEAMSVVSGLKIGLETGILSGVDHQELASLIMDVQPGHLQKRAMRSMETTERDVFRAGFMRGAFNKLEMTGHHE